MHNESGLLLSALRDFGQLYFFRLLRYRRSFIGVIVLAVTTGHGESVVDVSSFRAWHHCQIAFDFAPPMRWTRRRSLNIRLSLGWEI